VRQILISEYRFDPLLLSYISAGSPNLVAIYTKQGEPRGFLIRIVATYRAVHLRNGHAVTKGTYSIQPESNFKGIQWRIRAHRHADEKTNHLRRHYAIGLFDLSEEALLKLHYLIRRTGNFFSETRYNVSLHKMYLHIDKIIN